VVVSVVAAGAGASPAGASVAVVSVVVTEDSEVVAGVASLAGGVACSPVQPVKAIEPATVKDNKERDNNFMFILKRTPNEKTEGTYVVR
jgi:hypothetical protein